MRFLIIMGLLVLSGCVFQDSPEVPVSTENNVANNSVNNTTVSNNSSNNNTVNNTTPDRMTLNCENFCDLFLGECASSSCTLVGDVEQARRDQLEICLGTTSFSCRARYQKNDDGFRILVNSFEGVDCLDPVVQNARCETFGHDACGCSVPELLTTCTQDDQCVSDSLDGRCLGGIGADDGECFYLGCSVGQDGSGIAIGDTTGCGLQNPCIGSADGASFCLKGCSEPSDCPSGFACRLDREVDAVTIGYCDKTCGNGGRCVGDRDVCASPTGVERFCAVGCDTDNLCEVGTCDGANAEGKRYCIE